MDFCWTYSHWVGPEEEGVSPRVAEGTVPVLALVIGLSLHADNVPAIGWEVSIRELSSDVGLGSCWLDTVGESFVCVLL